jgi:hypothetical protein
MENLQSRRKDDKTQSIRGKIKLFIAAQDLQILSIPMIFIPKRKFITIHGIKSEVYAKDIVFVLKDNKIQTKRSCNCDILRELQSHSDQENLDLYLASKTNKYV